ncbi:MAG TPA: lytic transglycosylase domain-containing protein [Longimicrobiaceae bacterium]|nr:lytic transglycosylase domain-containing protein [Longimicrobiaceae bacterium]
MRPTPDFWNPYGGQRWKVEHQVGVRVEGESGVRRSNPPGSPPVTVTRYLEAWGPQLRAAAAAAGIPLELLLMTVATESAARWDGATYTYPPVRIEPGYTSDAETPHRISVGPMHLLLSTARLVLKRPKLTRAELADLRTNLEAAARYIADQRGRTGLDPILVAAAYNAGSVADSSRHANPDYRNAWHLRSYRSHLDRAAAWYGDACAVLYGAHRPPVPKLEPKPPPAKIVTLK